MKRLIYENLRCSQAFYFHYFPSVGASVDLNFISGACSARSDFDALFSLISNISNQINQMSSFFVVNLEDGTNRLPRSLC